MSVNIYLVLRHHIPDNWKFMFWTSVGTLLLTVQVHISCRMTAVGSDVSAVLNNVCT